MRWTLWCVCIACLLYHAQAQRPPECGDFVVNGAEVCDDGNVVDGDGCSSTCTIEAGFMCSGFGRAAENELGLGLVQDNAGAYSLSGPAEACLGTELCAIGGLWQPELWTSAAPGPMPPRAYYCATTCNGFGAFTGLQHDGACQLEDRNECVRGEAACDWHSVCENTAYGAGDQGLGYQCRCDRHHFVVSAQGQACALGGAELVLRVIGGAAYDAQAVPPADMAGLLTMRARFVDHLISKGVTRTGANVDDTRAALLEGVLQQDPELLEVIADAASGFVGHALWAVKVRMALELCNPSALMNLLSTDVALDAGLDAVFTGLDLRARARGVCSTDVSRECASDADCLSEGTCRTGVPDVRVAVLNAGGSLSPVTVTSGGLQVLSIVYDPVQTAWQARVRYAKSDLAGAMSVLYLSHVTPPVGAIEQATFRVSEFPCQPVGVSEFELDRSDTVCCLQTFNARYTPTQGFADYLAATPALTCAGSGPGAEPPPNATRTLLAGAGDFVAGSFVNTVRSSATLDPVQSTEGYQDVLLQLAEEDMRSVAGIQSMLAGGFRLRFFIGLAHFHGLSTTSLHVQFSQHEVISEITNTHVFTTSASTDFTFVRDVAVQLLQVRASATSYLKFALVELTVPPGLSASALEEGIIPAESLRASIGYTVSSAAPPVYPCRDLYAGAGRAQIDAVLAGQSDCAPQHPVCAAGGPSPVGNGDKISFMLPLDPQWWSEAELDNTAQALLHEHVFLDFMVLVQDAQGKRSLARMQTRTEVTRLSVASHCERVQLQNGIAGLLQIDVLLGLASTEATYADSVIEYSDVASGGTGTLAMARNVSSPAANTVTLIVTGDDALFTQEFALGYSLEIEDLSSVHVIDADKRTAVDALMAGGSAFTKYEDAQSYSIMRYEPTTELLLQCPAQQTRGVRGCATRRVIRERMPDFTSQSIIEIGPPGPIDEEATFARTGAWLQRHLGQSQFIYDLGYNHSKIVHERYRLDQRYRRAFVITPTTPWSSAQMLSAGVASVLDLAEHTIMSFLVALDRNNDASTIPTVQMDVPSTLQVSSEELLNDPVLQEAVEASYAEAMGLQADNVVLDESSVQEAGARRRLLAPAACQFKLRVEIMIMDEGEAMEFANHLRTELVKDDSPVVLSLLRNLNTKVRAVKPEIPAITRKGDVLSDTLVIPPPKKALGCKDVAWEHEVTSFLGLGLFHTDADNLPVTGWVSCAQRYYKLTGGAVAAGDGMLMPNTTIRGASQASDWQRFYDADTGTYPHVTDPTQQQWHWEWWDLCGEPPIGQFYGGKTPNDFSRAWAKIQAEARQQCCLCRRQPLVPNTFTEYVHKYSWPLAVDSTNDNFYDVNREDTLLLNTQSGNFANKRSKNFDASSMFVPETWSVEAGTGRTVTLGCKAGEYERRPGQCIACAVGKYRPLEDEHTKRSRCLQCPASKSSPAGSVSLDACVCGAGFQPDADAGGGCDACPANTYKDAPGNWACLACPAGSIASPGATSAAQCVTQEAYTDTLGRTRLYVSVLGALMHLHYVEPNWAAPTPAQQDNARMCTVSVDGKALNCPGATHPNAFSKPLVFATADDAIAQIEYNTDDDAFQRNNVLYYHGGAGYACRLKFYLTPAPSYQFQVGGLDRADLKNLVNHIGFKVRPHYMGPAPPGLTERVLEDAAWGATTVLTTSLRALVPGLSLAAAAPAQVLRLVQFVATKRLDVSATGTDWRWVVCGQAAPENHAHAFVYGKCAAGADPDDAGKTNLASEHVLDLRVFELSNTDAAAKSCFYKHWWVDGCDAIAGTGMSPDAAEMFDGVLQWEPEIAPAFRTAEQLWVYTYFMLGDSEACLQHNCDEAAVYAQMPAHVAAAWQSTWDTEIQLLPGTAVTLHEREPPVPVSTTPLFDTAIGLLRGGDACTVADGGLECADHGQVRAYPGLYAAAVDATTLAAGVPVEPVTSAVPHAPVFEHGGQAVAAVATRMPGLGVAAGQTAQASVYVRLLTEVPCADPCGPGTQNGPDLYDPNAACTPCPVNTYKGHTGYEACTPCSGNLVTTAEGSTAAEQCLCGPNTFYQNEQCYACPDGGFKSGYNLEATCGACRANSVITPGKAELRHCQCDPGYSLEVGEELEAQQSSILFSGTWFNQPIIFANMYNAAKSPGGICDLTQKFYGPESGCFRDTPCWPVCDGWNVLPCQQKASCAYEGGYYSYYFQLPFGTNWRTAEPVRIAPQRQNTRTMGIYGDLGGYGQTWGQSATTCAIECRHCTQAQVDSGACPTPYYLFGYDWANSQVAQCTPCSAGTAKATSGNQQCTPCPPNTYSLAGATACTPCPANSDTGGLSGQGACLCPDGLVFADGRCDWAPSAWAGADPTGYAYRSVERLYPPAALRGASPGFASADDASPDVQTFASGDAAYATGRYAIAYSSIDTAAGYTGFGAYNVLRHGDSLTAQHDGNWAPGQYANGAYTGTADLTGTLPGEWLAIELPVAVLPTRVVIATNGLNPATVAYSPHHFALFGYGSAGAWVKLHEEVLTAASYTHTLAQVGDSYALELSGVTACYHIFALVVPTVGAADALSFGELQIFGREKFDACPSGTEVDADNVCQVVEASTLPYAVSFAVSLPLTEAEFDATAQTAYKASVATLASVQASAVSIDSMTAVARRRRLLSAGIEVATSVQAASLAAATTISTSITIEALNTQLDTAGLPAASMVSAPAVVQNTCLLPGFHISGTGLAAALV